MATDLRLTDGTLTVNMTTESGPKLAARYLPTFPVPRGDGTIGPYITETLPVYVYITGDDNLASSLQDIGTMGRYAAEYASGNHQTPVWFYRQMEDESGGVRYLVTSVQFTADARFGGLLDRPPCAVAGRTGVLTITHHPYGERTSAVTSLKDNNISVIGGAADYTDVVGDVNARMRFFALSGAGITPYSRVWAGFRSDRRAGGDAGNVASLWEVEAGTSTIADTTEVADVTASPGAGNSKAQCDFSNTSTWARRTIIYMSDVTANYSDQIGAHLMILRAKVDTGSAQVRIRQGKDVNTVYRANPAVEIDATSWTLYVMGTCEWPGRDLHAIPHDLLAASYDQRDSLTIEARVTPGAATPTLDMDCIILIPIDEYFFEVRGVDLGQGDVVYVCVSPEDAEDTISVDTTFSWIRVTSPVSAMGAGIPVGDGRAFICAAYDDDGLAPPFASQLDVQISAYPRWVHFRGSE